MVPTMIILKPDDDAIFEARVERFPAAKLRHWVGIGQPQVLMMIVRQYGDVHQQHDNHQRILIYTNARIFCHCLVDLALAWFYIKEIFELGASSYLVIVIFIVTISTFTQLKYKILTWCDSCQRLFWKTFFSLSILCQSKMSSMFRLLILRFTWVMVMVLTRITLTMIIRMKSLNLGFHELWTITSAILIMEITSKFSLFASSTLISTSSSPVLKVCRSVTTTWVTKWSNWLMILLANLSRHDHDRTIIITLLVIYLQLGHSGECWSTIEKSSPAFREWSMPQPV